MPNSRWHRPARNAPEGVVAMVHYLMGRGKNADPATVAGQLGVSSRTVRAWLAGRRNPSKKNQGKLVKASFDRWEHMAREAAKKHGEPYVAGGGAEDRPVPTKMYYNGRVSMFGQEDRNYARSRWITFPITRDQGVRAVAAYRTGDREGLYEIAREVLADYFNNGGNEFEPSDLDFDDAGVEFV